MELFVFTFHHDGQIYRALSPLSPDQVGTYGLPTEAVLGQVDAALPSMTTEQFEQNQAFIDFLHQLIQSYGPTLPVFKEQALSMGSGTLIITDQRTQSSHQTPQKEDMIGQFSLQRGEIIPYSYISNPEYRVLTDNGPIQLVQPLEEILLDTLISRIEQ